MLGDEVESFVLDFTNPNIETFLIKMWDVYPATKTSLDGVWLVRNIMLLYTSVILCSSCENKVPAM